MNYKIPLFDINYDSLEEEAVVETLRSKWISIGPKNEEFERKFSEMLNVKHGLALANCTSALHLALKVLDIKEGDEVIVPSLTFIATVNVVKYVGATPVFCDITSIENPTIDPVEIEKHITEKTKAVIVMHYGGFPCDMHRIKHITENYNIKIVEDACHAPLSTLDGICLGTIGDIGCFSFFSNKNMSTGEGGMLVTNNQELYKRAKILRSHGMTTLSYERSKGHSTGYDVVELGYNYRMDDIRASIGIIQLSKLRDDLNKRAELRETYLSEINKLESIYIPFAEHSEFCSNYIFSIVLKNSDGVLRNNVRNELHKLGIQTSIHYPAVHTFLIYNNDNIKLPNTEYFTDNEITLPMHSGLTTDQVKYICDSLKASLENCKQQKQDLVKEHEN